MAYVVKNSHDMIIAIILVFFLKCNVHYYKLSMFYVRPCTSFNKLGASMMVAPLLY